MFPYGTKKVLKKFLRCVGTKHLNRYNYVRILLFRFKTLYHNRKFTKTWARPYVGFIHKL